MYGYSNANKQSNYHQGWAGNMVHTGADPAPAPLDQLKAFMEKETMGVKNKFLLGGAVVLGVGYYGYTKGWF